MGQNITEGAVNTGTVAASAGKNVIETAGDISSAAAKSLSNTPPQAARLAVTNSHRIVRNINRAANVVAKTGKINRLLRKGRTRRSRFESSQESNENNVRPT